MANKTIGQLTEATSVQTTDLFLMEQTGVAKKLTGQTLITQLAAALDGHGGIASSSYTAPVAPSLVGTLTLTLADGSAISVPVTNGERGEQGNTGAQGPKGDAFTYADFTPAQLAALTGPEGPQGDNWYVWIKWASEQPTSDSDIGDIPDEWMGVYGGASSTAPTAYTAYQWYKIKGTQGDPGDPITSVVRTSGDGSPGTDDTYTVYVNSTAVGTFIVHNGQDGLGTVNSINGIGVDSGTNNVTLTAADVGAPTVPLHIQVTLTSLPRTISSTAITSTMRVIDCTFATPSNITSDVTWTTSDGSLVLSGTMSGSTVADIILIETI